MSGARRVGAATSALVVLCGLSVGARDETQLLNMKHWARAVIAHQPGVTDNALTLVWTMKDVDRQYTSERLAIFVAAFGKTDVLQPGSEAEQLASLAHDLATTMTAKEFIERAAILHADAVIFDRRPPAPVVAPQPQPQSKLTISAPGAGIVSSPPRQQQTDPPFVTIADGEVTGLEAQNWNWPFGRLLVDQLRPAEADAFVSTWYHATTAYLLKRGELAEATAHLEQAARRLPNDARIDFDRGCLAESMAMNAVQQVASDDGSSAVTNRYAAARWVAQSHARIPSPAASNAQALDLFRQAATHDPHLVEARVRAARLLELEGHFGEARGEIRQTLAEKPEDAVTTFYAHLFGARADTALGQDGDADAHVRAALDLFPSAESAILAASQVAFHRADAAQAVRRLNELGDDRPAGLLPAVDPWRDYKFGAGRAVEPLLQDLWRAVPAWAAR